MRLRRQRLYPRRAAAAVATARLELPGETAWATAIRQILDEESTYGYRRVTFRLRRQRRVNKKRVYRLMRRHGWRSLGYQGRHGGRRREQAITEIEAWIHKYRSRREQAALGGLAPLEYRAVRLQQLAA